MSKNPDLPEPKTYAVPGIIYRCPNCKNTTTSPIVDDTDGLRVVCAECDYIEEALAVIGHTPKPDHDLLRDISKSLIEKYGSQYGDRGNAGANIGIALLDLATAVQFLDDPHSSYPHSKLAATGKAIELATAYMKDNPPTIVSIEDDSVNDIEEFAAMFNASIGLYNLDSFPGLSALEDVLNKILYKRVACGPWLKFIWHPGGDRNNPEDPFDIDGIEFGTIVEGSDTEFGPYKHMFPFSKKGFWAAVELMNELATEEWTAANSLDPDMVFTQYIPDTKEEEKETPESLIEERIFAFLEDIRVGGSINMLSATLPLRQEFGLTRDEADDWLFRWINSQSITN